MAMEKNNRVSCGTMTMEKNEDFGGASKISRNSGLQSWKTMEKKYAQNKDWRVGPNYGKKTMEKKIKPSLPIGNGRSIFATSDDWKSCEDLAAKNFSNQKKKTKQNRIKKKQKRE